MIEPREHVCSFCGRNERNAPRIIKGPAVYICTICLEVCVAIANDDGDDNRAKACRGRLVHDGPCPAHPTAGEGKVIL